MSVHLHDKEGAHRLMFEAHWALVTAGEKLHAAVLALHAAGRYAEARKQTAEPIAAIEKARELVDGALSAAADGRSKVIHLTGCDGTCSEGARTASASE